MSSRILKIIFIILLGIGGFYFYKAQTNNIFSNLSKVEIQVLLNGKKDKDDISLNKFKKNIEKLFDEQKTGTIQREPICIESAVNATYKKGKESVSNAMLKIQNLFSDKEILQKENMEEEIKLEEVNRLDGFVDEITSICYQSEIIYLMGKEKSGTITDKDISKFTNEIWNKYFYNSDILEARLEKSIHLFISDVEKNHEDIYMMINKYDDFNKSYTLDNEKSMLSLNEFITKQSAYSIGTKVSASLTSYSLRNLAGSLSNKLGKATKTKGKNWKSAITGTALSVVAQMWIYNASENELRNGISKQLKRIEKSILYGSQETDGLIQTFNDILQKYQEDEKQKLFNSLGFDK